MKFILVILAFSGLAFGLPQRPDGRMINGADSDIKDAGFTLSLQYNGKHFCAAAIVGNRVAVTTAKCLKGKDVNYLSVRAGSTYIDEGDVVVDVETFVIHPNYNEKFLAYDIAVFRTKEGLLDVSDVTTIVELGDQELERLSLVTAYGWGATDNTKPDVLSKDLKALQTWVTSQVECVIGIQRPIFASSMMCTFSGFTGMCQGDEGSPLINPNDFKLIGLASFRNSEECGPEAFIPDVYTNIPQLKEWIESYINQWA